MFRWDTLRATVGGRSAMDVPRLNVHDLSDAESFIESYGFLWSAASHRAELEALRMEAWALIEEELIDDEPTLTPPKEIRDQRDMRHVLVWGSERPHTDRQRWCCALLRVMHAMAHAHSGMNERFGPEIRSQLIDRIQPHVHRTKKGQLVLGRGPGAVPLVHFEVKHGKPLRSVAMKLLHKAENIIDVFDRLGFRFVTRRRLEALLVVRYLRANNVVMFAHMTPFRARNTLIDLDGLREGMRALDDQVASGMVRADTAQWHLQDWVDAQPLPGSSSDHNEHSASTYRSIQVTCRRLVRIPDDGGELRFFFPYEVQVMDEQSWAATRTGRASHAEYKARQRDTVKRRVLRDLLVPSP